MNAGHFGEGYTLNIKHPSISPGSPHYRIPAWPPPNDWPVVIDEDGRVVCRVGDLHWNFAAYGNRGVSSTINFEKGALKRKDDDDVVVEIDPTNRALFQRVMCWYLWGHRHRLHPHSLAGYAARIKPIFLLCAHHGVAASDLFRFPKVVDLLASSVAPSTANEVLTMLNELWTIRDVLGFMMLDRRSLAQFEAGLPSHQEQQTPYIPPRIWLYQIGRLRAFLEDFIAHKDAIENFFRYAHDAYVDNMGSLEEAYSRGAGNLSPFNRYAGSNDEATYIGSFWDVAGQFGISELLERWTPYSPSRAIGNHKGGRLLILLRYFRAANFVGHKYLLNLSGVRRNEGADFRVRCFEVERDPTYGDIFLLRGETSKSVRDDDAVWITSPSAKLAVDVMATIARLRVECAQANPFITLPADEVENPWLLSKVREPWAPSSRSNGKGRKSSRNDSYSAWSEICPSLFDLRELLINEEDIRLARLVTPSLDPERYAAGRPWHFHDHQLRRTTAVNMCASGLVSEPSLQNQLKHLRRAQSLYYGRGFTSLVLNRKYAEDYLRTAYEMLRRQIAILSDERYVSPLGERHKENLLKRTGSALSDEPLGKRDMVQIQKLVARGGLAAKPTLMGLCLSSFPCEWGGVLNIIHCSSCDRALGDRTKLRQIEDVRQMIQENLQRTPANSPDQESLELQLSSVEKFIRVLQS